MKPSITLLSTRVWVILFLCSALKYICLQPVHAETTEPLNCTTSFQIVQTFANTGKWEMCWEPRPGYGYKLSQIIFTPPNGVRRKIMWEMHAAQLFVPYDDNGARYRDISYGVNLATLLSSDCPGGTLLTNSTVCLTRRPAGYAYKNISNGLSRKSDSFELLGYYGVGAYYYGFKYTFFDDGSIEPSLLASGSLQRYGGSQLTGWPVGSRNSINHNHLAIWRMDFDLDGSANNRVEQIEFSGIGTDNRAMSVTPLLTETRATNDLTKLRFWRISNSTQNNNDGRNISYEIEPSVSDQLRASEDFTQNDFYLTQQRTSETLVDNGLVNFVNGETITDAVIWYGVNFHHVPRGEDDVRMPAHTQGFRIRPRGMTVESPASQNSPPVITNPGNQTTPVSTSVNLQIVASDSNSGDVLTYSATGLPSGLTINGSTGLISGTTAAAASSNSVTVAVSDGQPGGTASTSFAWNVTTPTSGGQQVFTAPGTVTIRDSASAQPYPISFVVSGVSGTVSKVSVTLNGLSHTYPSDLDILLVGPGGQKVMLMSDAGGGADVNNVTLTFDPAALIAVPQSSVINSGTYRPTNYGTRDSFPAPAPIAPYSSSLSAFNGTSANGTWRLFVFDDAAADIGRIANGAVLTITAN